MSNSTSTPLTRALTAYRRLDLHKRPVLSCRPETAGRGTKRALHLNPSQLTDLVTWYQAGATIYELATEFGLDRRAVSRQLKQAGTAMRRQSPTPADVNEMVQLYESGLSLARVGERLGFATRTVHIHVKKRGVRTRDTHGRPS